MAEKRMISKSISVSEKVNMLPDVFDMLLFTWLIPHSDDFGRLNGSPGKIKALVVPMMDKTKKDVEQSLHSLHGAELIIWYEVSGEKYIQIINFEKHQQGLHKRTKSKFPEPDGNSNDIPETSRNFPEFPSELNRTELKGTELNGTEQNLAVSDDSLILKLINQYRLNCKGTFQLEEICAYQKMMDIEVIEHAIKQSEGKSVSYAMSILDRFKNEGKASVTSIAPFKRQTKQDREADILRKFAEGGP